MKPQNRISKLRNWYKPKSSWFQGRPTRRWEAEFLTSSQQTNSLNRDDDEFLDIHHTNMADVRASEVESH
jgi:hypothetical protein